MTLLSAGRNSYPHQVYRIKVNLLGSAITILDEQGNPTFSVPVKDKGNGSELRVRRGKKRGPEVLVIRPVYEKNKGLLGKVLGFLKHASHFDVIDLEADETCVGAVKRKPGGGNPQDDSWIVLDASGTEIGLVEPVSSGFLGGKFRHRGRMGSQRVCEFRAGNTIAGRYVEADFTVDEDEDLDVRLGLAVAIKIVVAMKEMHSGA